MTAKESLRPTKSPRLMDLVSAVGIDVLPWQRSKNGLVKTPASNPKYCYEWSFVEAPTTLVNVWYDQIVEEADGRLSCDLNLKARAKAVQTSYLLTPPQRSSDVRRANKMDKALLDAYTNQLPVRVIVGQGKRRDISDPHSTTALQMKLRLLDQVPWSVVKYIEPTGECRLVRGLLPRFIDQFSIEGLPGDDLAPRQYVTSSKVFERDPVVRTTVLKRAQGLCEYCKEPGFRTISGSVYLETHHLIPLSQGGSDNVRNVVAICPNDHRQAHHGECRDDMRKRLLAMRSGNMVPR